MTAPTPDPTKKREHIRDRMKRLGSRDTMMVLCADGERAGEVAKMATELGLLFSVFPDSEFGTVVEVIRP